MVEEEEEEEEEEEGVRGIKLPGGGRLVVDVSLLGMKTLLLLMLERDSLRKVKG